MGYLDKGLVSRIVTVSIVDLFKESEVRHEQGYMMVFQEILC